LNNELSYYQRNKERILQYQKERYYNDRENVLEISKKSQQRNKVTISKKSKQRLRQYKVDFILYKGGKCAICGLEFNGENQTVFDFHHINPEDKLFEIAQSKISLTNDKMRDELDKCLLLCANCHLELHHKQRLKLGE
jgi:predicted HNH restriction endonuclease